LKIFINIHRFGRKIGIRIADGGLRIAEFKNAEQSYQSEIRNQKSEISANPLTIIIAIFMMKINKKDLPNER
jgi:hypothetical protein